MGFWNKLGKIALQAAPYVAAPFTGGASLYAVPATQKLGQKWSEHDANEAAKKGLGPSSFDKYLNMGSSVAGMAGGSGAFGKVSPSMSAGKFGVQGGGGGGGGWQQAVGGILDRIPSGGGGRQTLPINGQDMGRPNQAVSRNPGEGIFGRQMLRQLGPVMGRQDQNSPNLALSIGAGRMEAIKNQPWRAGYDVISQGPEPANDEEGNVGPEIRTPMPPIYPTGGRRRRAYN